MVRFYIAKYGYSKEQQVHFLRLIASYLTFTCSDHYLTTVKYIDFTLTQRSHLGKIVIIEFRKSNLTDWTQCSRKKLGSTGWCVEYDSRLFLNIVQPLRKIVLFIESMRECNTRHIESLKKMITYFEEKSTLNYILK